MAERGALAKGAGVILRAHSVLAHEVVCCADLSLPRALSLSLSLYPGHIHDMGLGHEDGG